MYANSSLVGAIHYGKATVLYLASNKIKSAPHIGIAPITEILVSNSYLEKKGFPDVESLPADWKIFKGNNGKFRAVPVSE